MNAPDFAEIFKYSAVNGSTCADGSQVSSLYFDEVLYEYDGNHAGFDDGSYGNGTSRRRGELTRLTNKRVQNGDVRYRKNMWYNSKGLLATERVVIGGSNSEWEMKHAYDASLRPVYLYYPDNELVITWFNSRGLPSTLASGPVQDSDNIVDNVSYTEAGADEPHPHAALQRRRDGPVPLHPRQPPRFHGDWKLFTKSKLARARRAKAFDH